MARTHSTISDRKFEVNLEIAKHLMQLGNLAAGALVFGQAVSGAKFDFKLALIGLLTLAILYIVAWILTKGGDK